MARMFVRSCAVLVALALAGSGVCAQSHQPIAAAQTPDYIAQQNSRIVSLLEQLADQARASSNLVFAVRAQSQAAKLLWAQEPDRARAIYRRAFQSLAPAPASKTRDNTETTGSKQPATLSPSLAEKQQLRGELLNQIAARDPALAEDLARGLVEPGESTRSECGDDSIFDCNSASAPRSQAGVAPSGSKGDAERCELLMSAALQVVDRDPQQALTFAQMSVALGISSNLERLLTLMRAVDAERADLLFSNAVARLERSSTVDLADVRTLGSYVVSVVNSESKRPLSKPLVLRFLNFAFSQIAADDLAAQRVTGRDSAARYFIGRQLTDLFGRYLPYRLDQLRPYVSDQGEAGYYDEVVDPSPSKVTAPRDIAREAIEATDPGDRDALFARAALAWLTQGEFKEAQTTSLKISDSTTRDRVLSQIVRRRAYESQIDDLLPLTRRITNETARIELLALLSNAARGSKDNLRAAELLDEAASCTLKTPSTLERVRSLVMIANGFSTFDKARSFEILQAAVKTINDLVRHTDQSKDEGASEKRQKPAAPAFTLDELEAANFDSTLASLAKADFDGALELARQLPGEEASVIAQLAVCGGGLADKTSGESSTSSDEIESVVHH